MAKKSAIQNNLKKIRMSEKLYKKRASLSEKINDKNLPIEERFNLVLKLSKLPRNSSRVRVRNRCESTGRPRGFYRKFKLSRIELRTLASNGLIPGIKKASW